MVSALERFVMNGTRPAYPRVCAWWVCVQCCCTFRFFFRPSGDEAVTCSGQRFCRARSPLLVEDFGVRQSSRVTAARDRRLLLLFSVVVVAYRVVIPSAMAPFARDFLLPAPSAALTSCLRTELTYDVAYSLQVHLMLLLTDSHGHHLTSATQHFWTPHSGRNFFPSATAALDFAKADSDFLRRWSPKGSSMYARVSQFKIQNQRAVVQAVHTSAPGDPLAEAETLTQLHECMLSHHVGSSSAADIWPAGRTQSQNLPQPSPSMSFRTKPSAQLQLHRWTVTSLSVKPLDQVSSANGVSVLERAVVWQALETTRAKNASFSRRPWQKYTTLQCQPSSLVRTLHKMGSCFTVPGVEYFQYTFAGETLPALEYDTMCKNCTTKSKSQSRADFGGSETSSLTCIEE